MPVLVETMFIISRNFESLINDVNEDVESPVVRDVFVLSLGIIHYCYYNLSGMCVIGGVAIFSMR